MFFADLDGLKTINDQYGHDFGDKAIQAEAEVLRTTFRKMDVIGRLSGDEFGIIASGMDFGFVNRLREKIDAMNREITEKNNFPFQLSISLGAVQFSPKNKNLTELLMMADQVQAEGNSSCQKPELNSKAMAKPSAWMIFCAGNCRSLC